MVILFWCITVVLTLITILCLWPWYRNIKFHFLFILFFCISSYALYFYYGSSLLLSDYYSKDSQKARIQLLSIRPNLSLLLKQEVSLRLRLEDFPEDTVTECQLLDILAMRALQQGEHQLALQYWQKSLQQLPNNDETLALRNRMLKVSTIVKKIISSEE